MTGVFVYRGTEAGLLLKFMRGYGLVSFKGGRQAAKIRIKGKSFGAQVGGSAEWGVGLVMGLNDTSLFGGDYTGSTKRATAADETVNYGELLTPSYDAGSKDIHHIFLVITGRGLSAGVARSELTITTSW